MLQPSLDPPLHVYFQPLCSYKKRLLMKQKKSIFIYQVHSNGLAVLGSNVNGDISSSTNLFRISTALSPFYFNSFIPRRVSVTVSKEQSDVAKSFTWSVQCSYSKYKAFRVSEILEIRWESFLPFDTVEPVNNFF